MPSEFAIKKTKEYYKEEDPVKKKKIIREIYDMICLQGEAEIAQIKVLFPNITDNEIFDLFTGQSNE